jgi:hypothetical protein
MVKSTHSAVAPRSPQIFPFAVALLLWAAYLQAGLPFHSAARELSPYWDAAALWSGGGAFFPQFLLAVLVGSAWQWVGRAWWVARPGRALGFYLGVSLAITILFISLGLGSSGRPAPWPIAGWIAGLALGAVPGWFVAGMFAPRTKASEGLSALWGFAVFAAVCIALLPLDIKASLSQLALAQWDLPERVYQLIKPAILWAAIGLIGGLAGHGRQARLWGLAGVSGFLVCAPLAADVFLYGDVVEVMALLPGLAMGLWLGQRSRIAELLGQGTADMLLADETVEDISGSKASHAQEVNVSGSNRHDHDQAPDRTMPPQTREGHAGRAVNHPSQSESDGLLHPLSAGASLVGRVLGVLLLGCVVLGLIDFPLGGIVLAVGLAGYMAALWRWPSAWLIIVPAALPLLDLAPWTGRFFWDEFDLLMLVTLAIAMWQGQFRASAWHVPKLSGLLAVFVLITSVSLMIGLFPLQAWDANALSAYWSHYNSLRLAKGLLWGLVFYGLYRSLPDRDAAFVKLAAGMALGVLGVSAWALWEQAQFAGAATTTDYRVTGSFSSMHTGGGHFEAYLVMALPFVWGLFFVSRHWVVRGALAAIFLLGSYALFSTVARGGAIALGVALLILTAGTWRALGRQSGQRTRFAAPMLLGVLTVAVMIAGASGVFWKQRIAQTVPDAGIRLHHWSEVLDMRDSGWMTALFGQGLGSLPATNLASQLPDQAGSYRYAEENGNPYLALNSAGTLYMAQRVAQRPAETLTLHLSARAPAGTARLEASLCEKSLFNSRQCQWLKLDVKPGTPGWQTFSQTFSSGEVGAGNLLTRRPVQFSLYNPVPGTVIEVDAIRLLDAGGQNLVKNGDFSRGGDFWFFKSGDHLFWHAKNLWVHLLFEQGWLGALLFGAIMILALVRLARSAIHGALESTVWLAALAALATVGVVESLVDAPRLALLVYGVLFVGAAWGAAPKPHAARPKRSRHRSHSHLRAEPKRPVV